MLNKEYKRIDDCYPASEKVVLVTDHLNTHTISSLYETYPPQEVLRLPNRPEAGFIMTEQCFRKKGGKSSLLYTILK